jgi:hypothetical protein
LVWKDRFLQFGLGHIGLKDVALTYVQSMTPSSLSPLFLSHLFLKVKQHLVAGCVMEGFHDVLPREHLGAFYGVPWGLYKEMPTNNDGQPDIVTHTTNI